MMNKGLTSLVAAVGATLLAGAAHANTVSLSNMTATWYDGTPSGNVSYSGNGTTAPEARWGTGGPQSGYDFDIAAQPITFTVPPSPSPNAVLGTFTHLNNPIDAGTSITSIKLQISAKVTINDGIADVFQQNLNFFYSFSHWETDNGAEPCANGEANNQGVNINGCADRVIANWLSTSDSFVIGNDTYTLNVIGFSTNQAGTNPFTSFWTTEKDDNEAFLVGNVALRSEVGGGPSGTPEPGSIALVGLALAGLAAASRRGAASKR